MNTRSEWKKWKALRYRLKDMEGVLDVPIEDLEEVNVEDFLAVAEEFSKDFLAFTKETANELRKKL